jgi:predicted nuclease of restriction endonuclease-like (RecB) superfamily
VRAYWLIGREIVEEQQRGAKRASYGERMLRGLAARLAEEYGPGFSFRNLSYIRQFFLGFPDLLSTEGIVHAPRAQSWHPGRLHSSLSWTQYRALLKVEDFDRRGFYEIEAVKNDWSGRELERQINSLLYERLAKSRDKAGLMRLAVKGNEIRAAGDIFKDPVVMEFLGMPESPGLVESHLEQALIGNLQKFLLELGTGFAFLARQERLTLDGDHFYVDLVFYHAILKCYVLIDLKVGKLTHQDLGQMQLYVNYFDRKRRSSGDGPTLGLVLCTDKNDAVVRFTLGEGQKNIFASRYKLHLPTEAELKAEIQRELLLFPRDAP